MPVQQPGEGKQQDRRDVGGITLGDKLLQTITQGKQQLRLGRMQVGRGEQRQSAGLQQPRQLGEKETRVLDVLDYLHRQGEIKRSIDFALRDLVKLTIRTNTQRFSTIFKYCQSAKTRFV